MSRALLPTGALSRRRFLETTAAGAAAVLGWPTEGGGASAADQARPIGTSPDVAVVGAGAFGGWSALYLREMGIDVALIDQYGPGNARSSSGSETRQLRARYGDHEIYTRWALKAFDRWREREAEWGRQINAPQYETVRTKPRTIRPFGRKASRQ